MSAVERVPGVPDLRVNALDGLRAALAHVHAYLPALEGDIQALVAGHQQLVPVKNDLATLIRDIEAMVIAAADGERRIETQSGLVEIRTAIKRSRWRSRELLKQLVVDAHNDGGMEAVWQVISECIPITASLGWRTGALKDNGITPSDWCLEEPQHKSVTISSKGNK